MKFLEAKKLIAALPEDAPRRKIVLAANFQTEPLQLYIEAIYAKTGIAADVQHIEFGGLVSFFLWSETESNEAERDVLTFLMPWDLEPSLDWRMAYGEPLHTNAPDVANQALLEAIKAQSKAIVYFDVPTKPNGRSVNAQVHIQSKLLTSVLALTTPVLRATSFHLESYFHSSVPLAGNQMGPLISELASIIFPTVEPKKVIITDLDNTLWSGIIGEEGIEGISFDNQSAGYPHYVYQSLLKALKSAGVLIGVVSKNDQDLAELPFKQGEMVLKTSDVVTIVANYEAKSSQINAIAHSLDLPTSAFVFVDDNPVELEEVRRAIPDIIALQFTPDLHGLEQLFSQLQQLCIQERQTVEDRQRTDLYRTRLKGQIASEEAGSNIEDFLKSLNMELTLSEKTVDNYQRALQLINKTNQFNLNGHRLDEKDLLQRLNSGERLITASLTDKHGSHGEIMACLIGGNEVSHLVMSCRVMNRYVEFAFLSGILHLLNEPSLSLSHFATPRNSPMQKFISALNCTDNCVINEKLMDAIRAKGQLIKVTF